MSIHACMYVYVCSCIIHTTHNTTTGVGTKGGLVCVSFDHAEIGQIQCLGRGGQAVRSPPMQVNGKFVWFFFIQLCLWHDMTISLISPQHQLMCVTCLHKCKPNVHVSSVFAFALFACSVSQLDPNPIQLSLLLSPPQLFPFCIVST